MAWTTNPTSVSPSRIHIGNQSHRTDGRGSAEIGSKAHRSSHSPVRVSDPANPTAIAPSR